MPGLHCATCRCRATDPPGIPAPHHVCASCQRPWGRHAPADCAEPPEAECGACAVRRVQAIRDPAQQRAALRALRRAAR